MEMLEKTSKTISTIVILWPVKAIFEGGEAFLLTVRAFLLTVELLCLQSAEVLLRHTFPLRAKKLNCKPNSSNCK